MIYTFNKKELKHEKVSYYTLFGIFLFFMVSVLFFATLFSTHTNHEIILTEEARVVLLKEQNEFSEEKLDAYIKELNIKFPHIVKAQSILETGNYQSEVFRANNNLFGMKVAKLRPTTALGENLGHAYYANWRNSVLDYAFYSAAYLRNIKTEDEYFQYLKANYAEDPNYVTKIKQLIQN